MSLKLALSLTHWELVRFIVLFFVTGSVIDTLGVSQVYSLFFVTGSVIETLGVSQVYSPFLLSLIHI